VVEIPYAGRFPLVLDTIIHEVCFTKVLIDGGSALNILFASALSKLGLSKEDLTPVNSPF
jgi:hypothetical protein